MSVSITEEMLRALEACANQRELFKKRFPEGAVFDTLDALLLAVDKNPEFDYDWLAVRTLKDPAWTEYQKVRSAAWAEHEKVRSAALTEYRKVRGVAWADQKALGVAWAEYEKVMGPAWTEYQKVRSAAWARAYWEQEQP